LAAHRIVAARYSVALGAGGNFVSLALDNGVRMP
jgi:hypothetical protein